MKTENMKWVFLDFLVTPPNFHFLIYSQVAAIVDHKKQGGKTMYRVRWKGYSQKHDSWQTANDLSCKDLLRKYRKKMEKDSKDVYTVRLARPNKGVSLYANVYLIRSKRFLITVVSMELSTIEFDGKATPLKTIRGSRRTPSIAMSCLRSTPIRSSRKFWSGSKRKLMPSKMPRTMNMKVIESNLKMAE